MVHTQCISVGEIRPSPSISSPCARIVVFGVHTMLVLLIIDLEFVCHGVCACVRIVLVCGVCVCVCVCVLVI